MSRREMDGGKASPWLVLDMADSFFALSKAFTDQVPISLQQASDFAATRLGELCASATNRSLAVELYLKAMLIAMAAPVPQDHDLLLLYMRLPESFRAVLEARYEEKLRISGAADISWSLNVTLQLKNPVMEEFSDYDLARLPRDTSLPGLLRRNRTSFVMWRYVHEGLKFDQATLFTYDYLGLGTFCEELSGGLHVSIPKT